jgi:hypothetical protein
VDPVERLALQTQLDAWRSLQIQFKRIEGVVETRLHRSPAVEALRTIPGVECHPERHDCAREYG